MLISTLAILAQIPENTNARDTGKFYGHLAEYPALLGKNDIFNIVYLEPY